jgi:CRISPR/Cas system CMR-associated protein Cmr5 small subunit
LLQYAAYLKRLPNSIIRRHGLLTDIAPVNSRRETENSYEQGFKPGGVSMMKNELFGDVGEFGKQSNFVFDVLDAGRYRNSSHLNTDRVSYRQE